MRASKALKISNENKIEAENDYVESVLVLVKRAALLGKTRAYIPDSVGYPASDILRSLGYKLDVDFDNESSVISWYEADEYDRGE